MKIKPCMICGNEFQANAGQKYCSPQCARRAKTMLEIKRRKKERFRYKPKNDHRLIADSDRPPIIEKVPFEKQCDRCTREWTGTFGKERLCEHHLEMQRRLVERKDG